MQTIQINTANQATVLQALEEKHKVQTGFVCNSLNDIQCIDGVCNNPEKHQFWTIEVNGDYQSVNSMSLVKPGDQVVLKYASSKER